MPHACCQQQSVRSCLEQILRGLTNRGTCVKQCCCGRVWRGFFFLKEVLTGKGEGGQERSVTIRDCQHTNASPTFTKLQFLPPRKGSPPRKGQRVVAPSDGPHVANSFSVTVTAARRRSCRRYTGCCVAMKGDGGSSRRHAGPQDGFHTWLRMLVQKSQGLASFFFVRLFVVFFSVVGVIKKSLDILCELGNYLFRALVI